MSTTIDERVVEMRFDNKQFESNVSTSMSTLDKLKQKLNLSGASKGLEDINTASKKVNMAGLGSSVEAVSAKFSAMQVIGITALSNITNSAVDAGKRIVSALTIDPIRTGFQEYETQINAVQTILANTSSKGTTIDQVNAALDELNHYADLTIYNFTEMTRNIGTFTAAGIDLETSVSAIQGIANLAAVSGSNSQQASTAMYQLSQALATGTVKLMDWNSVVNAGMGGEVFQNALKETSRLLGTGADEAIKASGSFRESLSDGWLTAEVLTETLKKFTTSGAAEYLAEFTGLSQETVDATLEATDAWGDEADAIDKAAEALASKSGKNKDEIKAALQMAKNAEDAATKVKTFTQLWDVLKESAQSGWSSTWKIIIGDFEDAKALLTPLADTLTGFINKMSDWRNNILQAALDFSKPWKSITEKINGVVKPINKTVDAVSKVTEAVTDLDDIVNKVIRGDFGNGKDRITALTEAGINYYKVQNKVNEALGNSFRYSEKHIQMQDHLLNSQEKTTEATDKTTKATGKATEAYTKLSDEQLKQAGLTKDEISLYRALEKEADRLGMSVSDLAKEMSENDGRSLLIDSFKNAGDGIIGIAKAIKEAWIDVFNPPGVGELAIKLYGAIKSLNEFSEKLRLTDKDTGELNETGKKLQRTFKGIFAIVDIVTTVLGSGLKIAFKVVSQVLSYFDLNILDVTASIGDALVKFHDWFESIFDISGLLDAVVPLIQKAANAIRDWFGAFKASKGMQNAISYIKEIGSSIKEWWSTLKDSENLPKTIAEGIVNFFSNIPTIISTICSNIWSAFKSSFSGFNDNPLSGFIDKIKSGLGVVGQTVVELGKIILEKINGVLTAHGFEAISADAIAGLANGLRNGAVNAWNAAVELARNLVQKVKDFLGIHSPSTVFMAIGGFIIAGLVLGLQNGIPDSLGAIKDVFQPMLDWIKGLDFGSIIAAALGIGTIGTTYKAVSALDKLASPLEGLGAIFQGTGEILRKSAKPIAKVIKSTAKVVKGFGKTLNAVAFDINAKAIKTLGETLLMLVGAIVILTFFDPGELWNAVGIITVLALVLAGLAFAISKINKSSASISREGLNIKSLSSGLIGIGAAILLMAASVKMIGSLDPDQAKQGFLGLAGLIVAIGVVIAAFGIFVKGNSAKNMDKFGKSMLKLSFALLLMSYVIKVLGGMDKNELIQGGLAIAYFAGIMVGLMAATKLISGSKNVDKIGSTLLKIALAIGVMALVVKALGDMDQSELIQGGLAITYFAGIIVGLMAATKLINGSKNVGEIGGALLKISMAIGVMGYIAKLLGGMDRNELIQGGLAITAFAGIIVGLMAATKLISGSKNVEKIGLSLLAISGAIAIMALTAFMLSTISWEGFAKGTIMITAFAGIIVGLMAATKLISGSKNVESIGKTLMAVSGAIAILAGIAVLLGMVPTKNLIKGTVVVVALAAVMAGLMAVTKLAKKSVGNIVALTVMIAVLAGAVYLISKIDSASAIRSAIILGGLMLVMTGVLAIVSLIGKSAKSALKGVLLLTAMALPMLAFVGVLALMSGVENATTNVKALAILVGVLTLALIPLTIIGAFASAALLGVLALTAMALPMLAFVGVLAIMSNVKNAMSNAILLGSFMSLMAGILVILAPIAPLALIGVAAMAGLTILIGAIGTMAVAVGALMEKFPGIQQFLDTGLPVLEQLAGSIGTMIGKFIGGIGEGLGDSLVKIGADINAFMLQIRMASLSASGIKGESFDGVKQLMLVMAEIGGTSILTGITDLFSNLLSGESSMEKFVSDAKTFFEGMKEAVKPLDGFTFNEQGMNAVITAAERLSTLQSSLEPIGGVISWFKGRDDLGAFGENVGKFVSSMITAFSSLDGVTLNVAGMNTIIASSQKLAELQGSLEPIGGVISWFKGRDDLGTFGENVGKFVSSMITAFSSLDDVTFNTEAMNSIVDAATSLSELQGSLESVGGVVDWFTGHDDLGTFGENAASFIESMKTAFSSLDDVTFNTEAMDSVISAAEKLAGFQSTLEPMGGVIDWFKGQDDLGTFGENVGKFAEAMGKLKEGMGENGITEAVVSSVANAGSALVELQKALPEEHLFDGKMNLSDFSNRIDDFSAAISEFGKKAIDVDPGAVSTVISTAYRIKALITSLVDLDTSGVKTFTGIGTGGFGADGPAYDIARAIVKFSETVDGIDTGAVTVAVSAAQRLKSLISGFVGLDTSGIKNFKPEPIGTQIKKYSNQVAGINTGVVSSSISSANRLKNFISGLSGLDTSGISNFKIGSIGTSLKAYGNSVSAVNMSAVSSSITAANRLKNFISSLSGLNSNGVNAFKTAIDQLSTVNIAGLVKAFSGASAKLSSAGANMINGLIKGMQSKMAAVTALSNNIVMSASKAITSKASTFANAGRNLATKLATGITNKKSSVSSAVSSCISSAVSKIRDKYNSFYSAGSYLVTGFANGISANAYRAAAKARAMAQAAEKAARDALDINSPSKVFKKIGSGVPEGFAIGIGMLSGTVKRSVVGMASTAIVSTRKAMSTILDTLNTDMDAQPTIRPVIDLTDVRSGASAINGLFSGTQAIGVQSNLNAINAAMNRKLQNGANDDVVSAINKLNDGLENNRGDTYNFGDFTYGSDSEVADAVKVLIRAAKMGRRV